MTDSLADQRKWVAAILDGANERDVERFVNAINDITARRKANTGSVIIACARILAQCFAEAPVDVAAELRSDIIPVIDGDATKSAVLTTDRAMSGWDMWDKAGNHRPRRP